jgi:hypothetical protein
LKSIRGGRPVHAPHKEEKEVAPVGGKVRDEARIYDLIKHFREVFSLPFSLECIRLFAWLPRKESHVCRRRGRL